MPGPTCMAEAWHAYADDVLTDDTPIEQAVAIRRAYYAGGNDMLTLRDRQAAAPLRAEIRDFGRTIGREVERAR